MPKKATSPKVAKIASKLLKSKTSMNVKKVAGSALGQREKGKKKK